MLIENSQLNLYVHVITFFLIIIHSHFTTCKKNNMKLCGNALNYALKKLICASNLGQNQCLLENFSKCVKF